MGVDKKRSLEGYIRGDLYYLEVKIPLFTDVKIVRSSGKVVHSSGKVVHSSKIFRWEYVVRTLAPKEYRDTEMNQKTSDNLSKKIWKAEKITHVVCLIFFLLLTIGTGKLLLDGLFTFDTNPRLFVLISFVIYSIFLALFVGVAVVMLIGRSGKIDDLKR